MEFIDVCFEVGYYVDKDLVERIVWVICIYTLFFCFYFSNEVFWKWVIINYYFEIESI